VELPFVVEPLSDGSGFTASLVSPFPLSAAAATPEEAQRQLAELVQRRLQAGVELRTLHIPVTAKNGAQAGWLPNDELTQDWLQQMQQYRAECDAADRARLENTSDEQETAS
jgi:hypothetical protein